MENETKVKEVVLTGINLGDYGIISGEKSYKRSFSFIQLLKEIEGKSNISRFRISSIEPNLCSNEIIDFVAASNKFMPHFHMPLQSGSDEILKSMKRRYRKALYAERVEHIRSLMPNACIGVDVIVGYPGETEEHFNETVVFLEELKCNYFHVFTYSERANTHAANLGEIIPVNIRRKRNAILRTLSEKKKRSFYLSQLGTIKHVLIEEKINGNYHEGFTENYVRVLLPSAEVEPNKIYRTKLIKMDSGFILGEIIEHFIIL